MGKQVKPPLKDGEVRNISNLTMRSNSVANCQRLDSRISTWTSANPEGYCLNGGSNPLGSHKIFNLLIMKPYGREKTVRFSCKQDCHPRKGWHNWWETMADYLSRTEIKRRAKKDIEEQINEKY